jgi:hypothetical protein
MPPEKAQKHRRVYRPDAAERVEPASPSAAKRPRRAATVTPAVMLANMKRAVLEKIGVARGYEVHYGNPEGRGGCWLMAFMAALFNLFFNATKKQAGKRSVLDVRARYLEVYARHALCCKWNELADADAGVDGWRAHIKECFMGKNANGTPWQDCLDVATMHIVTTDNRKGGWGSPPMLAFLMDEWHVPELIVLQAPSDINCRDPTYVSPDNELVMLGSHYQIRRDQDRKFAKLTEKPVYLEDEHRARKPSCWTGEVMDNPTLKHPDGYRGESINTVLARDPHTPVLFFSGGHYWAVIMKEVQELSSVTAHGSAQALRVFRELKRELAKSEESLLQAFQSLSSELAPCKSPQDWPPPRQGQNTADEDLSDADEEHVVAARRAREQRVDNGEEEREEEREADGAEGAADAAGAGAAGAGAAGADAEAGAASRQRYSAVSLGDMLTSSIQDRNSVEVSRSTQRSQAHAWKSFVKEVTDPEHYALAEARKLAEYLQGVDASKSRVTDERLWAKLRNSSHSIAIDALLELVPATDQLDLDGFRDAAAERRRAVDAAREEARAAHVVLQQQWEVRRRPERRQALQADLQDFMDRFNYTITQEFALQVLTASEHSRDSLWRGPSREQMFDAEAGTVIEGPDRSHQSTCGYGWRVAGSVSYRQTSIMGDVPLSLMELDEAWIPQPISKPKCGSTPGYAPKQVGGFLDISREGSRSLDWTQVVVLKPLDPPAVPTARGMLRHRTNSQFMRKYRSGRECVIEACVFGTGWTKPMLSLDGFTGPAFERGIELKHVNERFQKPGGPPFELMAVRHDGSACGGAGGGRRRGKAKAGSQRDRDGKERRETWGIYDLVSLNGGIFIAVAQVDLGDGPADGHAITWDAWRRILFLGPGDFNEHVCDGAILVDEEDLLDRDRRCDVYIGPERAHARMTLSEYVREIFGISRVTKVAALMVNAKSVSETGYV